MKGKSSRPGPPPPAMGRLRFLTGAAGLEGMPPDRGREVAFAGRSNAGKSSALNAIAGLRGLARTSKTPGRTQQVNFFALDGDRRLVDLPGYGYARVALEVKRRWQALMEAYLARRRSLAGLVLLMDLRHPCKEADCLLLDWCRQARMPVQVLLTKADKLGRGAAAAALQKARQTVLRHCPGAGGQLFSALDGNGVEEARAVLIRWLDLAPGEEAKKSPGCKGG